MFVFVQDNLKPFGELFRVRRHFTIKVFHRNIPNLGNFFGIKLESAVIGSGEHMIQFVFPEIAAHFCFINKKETVCEFRLDTQFFL